MATNVIFFQMQRQQLMALFDIMFWRGTASPQSGSWVTVVTKLMNLNYYNDVRSHFYISGNSSFCFLSCTFDYANK